MTPHNLAVEEVAHQLLAMMARLDVDNMSWPEAIATINAGIDLRSTLSPETLARVDHEISAGRHIEFFAAVFRSYKGAGTA